MKTVFKISKTELLTLFYSPIAWFLIIVFLVQCGMAYIGMVESNVRTQEIGGLGLDYMNDLTGRIFGGRSGVFSSVMEKLYFYIPLLTMGLISRETSSGTIKLLYSSPIKVWQIVLGKYFSMMVYSLLMIFMLGIFIVCAKFNLQHADLSMLLSGALGFYLLLCAYAAIGLFMSSLTTYQVVAAVSTFVMIGVLSYIGKLWQGIAVVRDFTYFLSLQGRTEHMLVGLITSKDIFYFVIIVYIFLGLTILKLKAGMESKSLAVQVFRYVSVVISGMVLGYITSRPALVGYLDATAQKTHTLTPTVQQLMQEMGNDKLEITAYNNLLGRYYYVGLPEQRNSFLQLWEPYLRFKPDIDFKYVNYYDTSYDNSMMMFGAYKGKNTREVAEQIAKGSDIDLSDYKTPAEIRRIINLKPELNRFVMQLHYKGRTTYLRIFDDQVTFPGETEVAAALKRLMQAHMPKIVFLTGELERSILKTGDREINRQANLITFRYSLVNQGFDVDTLNASTQDIPTNISALVIADPKMAFSSLALERLRRYIHDGGNLLVMGEPGKQSVVNPLLQQVGVQLMEGEIVQPSEDMAPDLATPQLSSFAATFSKSLAKAFNDSVPVTNLGGTALSYTSDSGFTVHPLLVTNEKKSWLTKGKLVADSATVVFTAANGDEQKAFPTALGLTRQVNNKEQRIIVIGDADLMSNAELVRYNVKAANFFFNTGMFSWLSYGQFPIDASRPDGKDKRMNMTSTGVARLKLFLVWILPAAVLLVAAILLIRRKRK